MAAGYNIFPKSKEQLAQEGRAGLFRSTEAERMSLCRQALRELGPCPAGVVHSFLMGAGVPIDESETVLLLERLIKAGKAEVRKDMYRFIR